MESAQVQVHGGQEEERHNVPNSEHVSRQEQKTEDETTPLATQDGRTTMPTNKQELVATTMSYERPRFLEQMIPNGQHTSLSLEGYFALQHCGKSPSRRPMTTGLGGSTQSSSGSLQALSEYEGKDTTLKRNKSTRSNPNRGRSISHSKVASISQPPTKRSFFGDHAFYPDQSFAQLSNPVVATRPHPILRTRSSHPAQNLLYNEMSRSKISPTHGYKTADNTPMSSPGLFAPQAVRQATLDSNRSGSPQLHHLQTPKETHTAAIEHDVYSGNKFINNYEIVRELGRGEHGKVKLGRDIEQDSHVAIKIVPRYSAKRRLGKIGAPEDRTKREIAILKKARHANVVSLLEVIDDPNKNKVYLILEFVDKGEIKWRKHGVREILAINNMRFDQERYGAYLSTDPSDRDRHIARQALIRHERLERMRSQNRDTHQIPNWSLEYAGDTDEEGDMTELSRSLSRQLTNNSVPSRANSQDDYVGMADAHLAGGMYGTPAVDVYHPRKFSIAASAISHMSSDIGYEADDDQHSYVPALTLEEARRAFRDTLIGLEFLHYIGIIHRDIKPANLLCCSNGMFKISDFGVSYFGRPTTEEEAERSGTDATPIDDEKELARSVGTPAFWAPELCYEDCSIFEDGKEPKVTGALDLWALGITLYCMIYARLPFYVDHEMGLHEAVCRSKVFCPRTRLVAVDTSSSDFVARVGRHVESNKRFDYELKFEVVPDAVRDLIEKLLIKDPAKRISIAEAKRHPWVVEDLSNESEWLQGPIEKEGKRQILDINEKELSHAVVKRNIIERALTTASRIAGNLLGRKDSRKRASSTATSAGSSSESLYSPAASTTSTIGKYDKIREQRRTSLRGDEAVLQALKASRDPVDHHPLAQSQTASPTESHPSQEYFTPAGVSLSNTAAMNDLQRRPRGPDRAASALSTADSVKTVRASQFQRALVDIPASVENPSESSFKSKVEGLWEGTTRTLHRLSSRDRQASSRTRSLSRPCSEHDARAEPSLAVSNTYAAGAISTPNVLMASEFPSDVASSPSSQLTDVPRHGPLHAPVSSDAEFAQAQAINQRRHLQEAHEQAEAAAQQTYTRSSITDSCPPSPDDEHFLEQSVSPSTEVSPSFFDGRIQTAASASTIASSIDEFCDSSVSDPSHGMASGASSPPEGFLSAEYKDAPFRPAPSVDIEPDFMRTADTVTTHSGPPVTLARPLEEQYDYFNEDGDDEDDSDDDGMVMGSLRNL